MGGGGAPAQLVGANFKSRGPRVPYALGGLSFLFLVEDPFFLLFCCCLSIFVPGPKGLVLPKGARQGGGANSGGRGGGADASIGPPGAGDPRDATGAMYVFRWEILKNMRHL